MATQSSAGDPAPGTWYQLDPNQVQVYTTNASTTAANLNIQNTGSATVGTVTATNNTGTVWVNSTPTPGVGQPVPYVTGTPFATEPSIHLEGENAQINFDGVVLTKEDVMLFHKLIASLKAKQALKKASEKGLTDAINEAVKELGG